ncbi:MAG: preprotein translocase subunit SecE [Erysipelotrichaceae bacterium]|jgi:preprotein translocase SecE subunit|nr:preprotein translocase subunit SecE [Erysipelotrichaceae bacterium]
MGLKKYVGEVVKEGKRVRWPKRDVLIPAIVTVVIVSIFFGVILLLEDWAGNTLLEIIKNAFAGLAK